MKNLHDIIIKPILSEKSYDQAADRKYTFQVAPDAQKIEIKEAIEMIFGVKVEKVTTMNVKGKKRRRGRIYGYTASTKKAVIKITEDSKEIPFFEGLS